MRNVRFAKRNTQEILRDPINLFFGLGFPLILLALLSLINRAIPAEAGNTMFAINRIAPGIAAFAPAFLALFAGMLLAKDRASSFLARLFTSPMTPLDFIGGYTFPMLAIAVVQSIVTFLAAALFGLPLGVGTLLAIAVNLPVSVLFIGIGLLSGSLMNDKAVGGICGALLTNVAGWLSGVWIPLDLIGGPFRAIARALPFYQGTAALTAAVNGDYQAVLPHLAIVIAYALLFFALATAFFRRKMSSGSV